MEQEKLRAERTPEVKLIAFHLPQFHTFPENDKWWGKGFTEWTNVKKAEPQYEGHYQPKVPLNNNYYCLMDDETQVWQSDLAQKYGVWGFCYYHYWFKDGKKLLEKPLERMLHNREVTIPFCLCWANENWTKRWDGGNNEIIVEQDYGNEKDWESHFEYLLQFFKDERYITLNGKPVMLIYRPEEIPHVNKMLRYWNKRAKEYGLNGLCFMIQNGTWFFHPSYEMGEFSYQIKFYPMFSTNLQKIGLDKLEKIRKVYRTMDKFKIACLIDKLMDLRRKVKKQITTELTKMDYDKLWETALASESRSEFIEGAFVDWDNTARKKNGACCIGPTPEKFELYMQRLYKKVKDNNQQPLVFINAWNEWGEGAYLEPDEKYQYRYLEAINKALKIVNE